MDGFAVAGAELEGGRREFNVVVVDIPAGRYVSEPVAPGDAARIMTGAPLPPGVDTIVQVEHTVVDGRLMTVETVPATGANVRRAGEDVTVGDVLFERGALLGGRRDRPARRRRYRASVRVARRPRVAILATGSELVAAGRPLEPGQIRNSNSFTAYGQVLAAGADPILLGIARDDPDETRRLLAAALESDVVITSGGVSVGDYDFVKQVQDELGRGTPVLGRRDQARQAARLRDPRRHAGVRRARQPGRRHGELRDVRAAGPPGAAGPARRLSPLVLRCVDGAGAAHQGPDRGAPLPLHARGRRDPASRPPARRDPAS